jgi:hypothetical protein
MFHMVQFHADGVLARDTTKKSAETRSPMWLFQECFPSLRRRSTISDYALGDGGLGDHNTEFEQLTMDAGSTPTRVRHTYVPDEISDFVGHKRGFA